MRITSPAFLDVPIVGRLVASGGDSLVVKASDGRATMRLPIADLRKVQVSEGRDRLSAALRFGVAGAATGAVLGGATLAGDPLGRMVGFLAGGILGAPIGAATGAIIAPEDWRTAWWRDSALATNGTLRLAIDEGVHLRFSLRSDTTGVRQGSSGSVVDDTLRLQPRGGVPARALALRDLSRLEISGGDDKRKGMLIGAGIVGGATAIFAGVDASKGAISAGDAVGTVAVNALLGALVGYAFAPAGWERLPLPSR